MPDTNKDKYHVGSSLIWTSCRWMDSLSTILPVFVSNSQTQHFPEAGRHHTSGKICEQARGKMSHLENVFRFKIKDNTSSILLKIQINYFNVSLCAIIVQHMVITQMTNLPKESYYAFQQDLFLLFLENILYFIKNLTTEHPFQVLVMVFVLRPKTKGGIL